MIAVDTNILVRLLTGDSPAQTKSAKALFESEPVWIAKTVLVETAWVLRSIYGIDQATIGGVLTRLLGLDNVTTEDRPAVAKALALTASGLEFADALHISSRPPATTFVTFDRKFAQRAKRAGMEDVSCLV